MNENSTPLIFFYSSFRNTEHSQLIDVNCFFDQQKWLTSKIDHLIEKCPDIPNHVIRRILEKSISI